MEMLLHSYLQGVPEKTVPSFTRDKFWTVRCKMKIFAPKCSALQNLCKRVKYSLANSRKWLHVHVSRPVDTHAGHPTDKCPCFYWTSNWPSNSSDLNPVDYYPAPGIGGRGIVFGRFLCFFVSNISRKRLDRFAWNFQGRCGVTMGRPD